MRCAHERTLQRARELTQSACARVIARWCGALAHLCFTAVHADGMHYGNLSFKGWGCHGFPIVTDVVTQRLLNDICRGQP
jgi:hypothetical protein